MDEIITLTKSELQALVAESVEKHLARNAKTTVITQRNVFNDLSEEFQSKIIDFNTLNGIKPYSHRRVCDAIWSSGETCALAYNIHADIRKVALSLMGVRKNEQLLFSELDIIRRIYKRLADVAYDEYVNRVSEQKN